MHIPTKNEPGNRTVLAVTYERPEAVFRIPDGIDLYDNETVESFWVTDDRLCILYKDGHQEAHVGFAIAPEVFIKRPVRLSVEDAEAYGIRY